MTCRSLPPAGDIMLPESASRALLVTLADKWAFLLIHALSEGPTRSGALKRRVGGISDKMLSQTLRRLESAGLVRRCSFPQVSPRVEYRLTRRGRSLSPLVVALDAWVERNARSDGRHPATDSPTGGTG